MMSMVGQSENDVALVTIHNRSSIYIYIIFKNQIIRFIVAMFLLSHFSIAF